jgi:hypothetical protein
LDLSTAEQEERADLLMRMPARIVDCHSHSSGPESFVALSEYGWKQARSSFPVWTIPDSNSVRTFLYGDREVSRLVMAYPFKGFDHRVANVRLLESVEPHDRVILCGIPHDRRYTEQQLRSGRYAGLKMYPHSREPPYEHVGEYFPDWALRAAGVAGVPAIVHVPAPLAHCADDVIALAAQHPETRFVLAHLGRQATADADARRAFARVGHFSNVRMDTSMVLARPVHELALSTFGPDRVLYGSDEPFNLLRYVGYQHPERGYRLVAPRQYHWLDEADFHRYRHLARDAMLVHLQVVRALFDSVDALFGTESDGVLAAIFGDNAATWFDLD